ncbi:MAG: hypothetical protein M4579_004431 [Chaenotheca gracillima]|nr:MAG: hypothetical protein M4579_004431 [Chaenotheca gracillima]
MSSRPAKAPRVPSRSSARGHRQSSIPNEYANLDELAGPPPIQNPEEDSWYDHRSLDEGRANERYDEQEDDEADFEGATGQQYNRRSRTLRPPRPPSAIPSSTAGRQSWLAEVGAPPPIQNTEEKRTEQRADLEGERTRTAQEDIESSPLKTSTPPTTSQPNQPYSRLATELYTVSYLIFFSLLGTLARLGMETLTFYPGTPLAVSSVWANFGGSFVMGFLSEDRKLFRDEWGSSGRKEKHEQRQHSRGGQPPLEKQATSSPEFRKAHAAAKKTIPLYIGLATGFCGSFTTFSTFMRDVFLALSNDLPTTPPQTHFQMPPTSAVIPHRNPGYSVMAVLCVLIVTIGLSIIALQLGAVLAIALHPFTPTIPFKFSRKIVDRLGVILGWGCWIGAIVMAVFPPDRPGGPLDDSRPGSVEIWQSRVLFALVFAPIGCLGRFYASIHLNGVFRSFPLGTFACNTFGTAVLGMAFDLQRIPLGGQVGCGVLLGVQDGFSGCLTTVSTWVVEITTLRRRHAWVYGGLSVVVGLGLLVVVIGSLSWSVGFSGTVC